MFGYGRWIRSLTTSRESTSRAEAGDRFIPESKKIRPACGILHPKLFAARVILMYEGEWNIVN